jgi:Protein of unknown function (DUF1566)
MKIRIFTKNVVVFTILGLSKFCQAQSVTLDPNSSTAIVDTKSTTKGVLTPRMTVLQRNTIPLSEGLQVYCTDCTPAGPYAYNGSTWLAMFQTTTVSPITYTIGQAAQGGKVFWIDETAQHGLVVATSDQSVASPWYNGSTNTKAIREGIYGGEFNTQQIIQSIGYGNFAASLAAQFADATVGYGDWYLPSKNELKLLFDRQGAIGITLSGNYWSSTELSVSQGNIANSAYQINFDSGGAATSVPKSTTNKVRAIRKF